MDWRIFVGAIAFLLAIFTPLYFIFIPQLKQEGVRYPKSKRIKDKKQTRMIAHRGLSGMYLENTLQAFEAAGKKSFYGIETDVHVTKDGKFIIVHDDNLRRVTGQEFVVEETEYEVLRELRFRDPYTESEEIYRLPSLEEYVNVCKKYDKQAILELKNKMRPQEVLAIAKVIEELGWLERTTFISFAGENLLALRKEYPKASAQYLVEKVGKKEISFLEENRLDCDLKWTAGSKGKIKRLHEKGIKVNCWTVDSLPCAKVLISHGIDFITSDIIE